MKKEHMIERDGKTFVLYAGLLEMAHEKGLRAITTTLVQIPNEMNGNVAICHATVEIEQGSFTGIGDAAPNNLTRMMAPHAIRMAETRAKARALRDAVNVGMASLEELGGPDDDQGDDQGDAAYRAINVNPPVRQQPRAQLRPVPRPDEDDAFAGLDSAPVPGDAAPKRAGYAAAQASAGREEAPRLASTPGGPAATPRQLETINKMARAAGQMIETDGLSREQASEIISKLIGKMGSARHGS